MYLTMALYLLLTTISLTVAHMALHHPPPLRAAHNPNTLPPASTPPETIYPYGCCNRPMLPPCRGFLPLLGTSQARPVATWPAGSRQEFSLAGMGPFGGNHYGGSCQVGFSHDGGESFIVATSFVGGCPKRRGGVREEGQRFAFVVPSDVELGEAVFAWTWNNREGEFFMNCAVVDLVPADEDTDGGSVVEVSSRESNNTPHTREQRDGSYSERPLMLFADVDNGCNSPRDPYELNYPQPGPDVVEGDGEYEVALPEGDCEKTWFPETEE